jgi:hypothetical protein
VVTQDLNSRPDDEHHHEEIEKVGPSDPRGDARDYSARIGAGIALDECLQRRHVCQAFADRHRRKQQSEADRDQPQQVEPLVAADPQLGSGGPPGEVESATVRLDIDGVFGGVYLAAIVRVELQRCADRQSRGVAVTSPYRSSCRFSMAVSTISVGGGHAAEDTPSARSHR